VTIIIVPNVGAKTIFTFTIVRPVEVGERIKWTIYKPYVHSVTHKQFLGGDQVARVVPNPGEPDEGKLSSPVR